MKGLAAFLLVLVSTMTYAEDVILPFPDNPKWEEECGSCHVAYPPQLLTQNDWKKLMERLDKHFGDNAVLDPKDNKEILGFLQRYAGSNNEHTAPSLRIRDTPWFTLKHRPIFSPLVTRYFTDWSNLAEKTPAVTSRASCPTCHVRVERGDWSKHVMRVPGWQRPGRHD